VDTPTLVQLARAFAPLTDQTKAQWGLMQPAQMVRHCRVFVDLCLGRVPIAWPVRVLARMLGPIFLRRMLAKSPTKAPKNLTTLKPLRMSDSGLSLVFERDRLMAALAELETLPAEHHHPLYGRMRKQDVIALIRHHTAHHATQFGLLHELQTATPAS